MQIFKTKEELTATIIKVKKEGKTVGFVPTMGALHKGHLSLFKRAKEETDYIVGSIFVNPIQFNNAEDLVHYPRTEAEDIAMLTAIGVDALFMPSVEEMYPEEVEEHYDFGSLERVMEGEHRVGHFNGVAVVVKRLFEAVLPTIAFFGQKDYQQLAIIRALVAMKKLPVKIVSGATVREKDGLALSSRNRRLSAVARSEAPLIYKTLCAVKKMAETATIEETTQYVYELFNQHELFNIEYFQLADALTLQPVDTWSSKNGIVGCIAVWINGVRLIDNILI